MERNLLWAAFAIGAAGWLCALLLTKPRAESSDKPGIPRLILYAAVALILVGHLVSMPSTPPFARGHGWGMGWLIGGIASLLAAWVTLRHREGENPIADAAAHSAPFFLALPAAVIPLLFMRTTVIDTILGIALGWLAISLLLSTLNSQHSTLLSGAAFAVTLSGTMALAVFRGAGIYQEFRWGAAAAVMASGIPLLIFLSALPQSLYAALGLRLPFAGAIARSGGDALKTEAARESAARGIRVILSALLLLGLAYLVSLKVVEQRAILTAAAIGIVAALTAWWLLRDGVEEWRSRGEEETGRREDAGMGGRGDAHHGMNSVAIPERPNARTPERPDYHTPSHSPLAVLVILAGIMVAYQLLAGFGVGIAVLAAWLVGGVALSGSPAARPLAAALAFGTVFVLYRVAVERFSDEMRGVSVTDHYALFGFVFGLLAPSLLSRLAPESADWKALNRLFVIGLLILAAPAGIVLVWGQKTLITFLFGLALAAASALSGIQAFRRSGVQALIAMAMAAAVAQWTHVALPLAALPRTDKLKILAWGVGIAVILLIATDLFSRIKSRGQSPAQPA